ncbi:transcription elongation factor TFIIS-like protein [Tanacetum coccineum]
MSQNKVHRDNSIKAARKEEIKVIKTEGKKVEKNGHNNAPTSEIKLNNLKVENKPTINDVAPLKLTSLVYCKDPIRDKIHELLAEALCLVSGEADDESRDEVNACDPYRVVVSVESAMSEKWGKSNGAHKLKIVESTPKEITSTERQMENVKIKEKALFDCERGAHQRLLLISLDVGDVRKGINNFFELEGAVVKSSVIHKALSHLRQLIISGQIRCRRLSVPLCA